MREVPIFCFFGFLDAGKTKFIQETMEDERFDENGAKTLLLVLEEGEEEYDSSRFAVKNSVTVHLPMDELTGAKLLEIDKIHRPRRIVLEYNGMLTFDKFLDAMPDGWLIAQVMAFFDATSFLAYNRNMRQFVFDKIQYADTVVFNRFRPEFDKLEFHKIVRAISRRPNIVYEYLGGRAEYDEIVDPLPFDIEAPVIVIGDGDYAYFYRDLVETPEKYNGKVVRFKGLVAVDKKMKAGTVVVGRHIMTCCEADIQYSGLVCLHASPLPLRTQDWVTLTARIDLAYHPIYGQVGPVLKATALDYAEPPEQPVATFF